MINFDAIVHGSFMKIAVTNVQPWEAAMLKDCVPLQGALFTEDMLTPSACKAFKDTEVLIVFVQDQVTKEVIDALPNLKLVITRSTGCNHIDVDICRLRGVQVAHIPSYGGTSVAEYSFALLLAMTRRLHQAWLLSQQGEYQFSDALLGHTLQGKTIGIIGTGDIGLKVAKIAKGFDMDVLAFDVKRNKRAARKIGFTYVAREELFEHADIISIHVPLNEDTYHMIDTEAFAIMKDGVFIVNTSRGEVIHASDLITALDEGKVTAAALDVLEDEHVLCGKGVGISDSSCLQRMAENCVLIHRSEVLHTPHVAFFTKEALIDRNLALGAILRKPNKIDSQYLVT